MRGERIRRGKGGKLHVGSSPHARGTLIRALRGWTNLRFIPACAGNARARSAASPSWPVHPRMRGERRIEYARAPVAYGSSPHARGPRANMRPCRSMSRFITACAGNAADRRAVRDLRAVHPRMRGECPLQLPTNRVDLGSSPHARGTHSVTSSSSSSRRFIPACAGNAMVRRTAPAMIAVHPRMRGERHKEP